MSSGKRDFYGKEVPDAIKKACDSLRVPQEELAIEVVETGSLGIFGLIRKKAHIRAVVKGLGEEDEVVVSDAEDVVPDASPAAPSEVLAVSDDDEPSADPVVEEARDEPLMEVPENTAVSADAQKIPADSQPKKEPAAPRKPPVEISPESVEMVRQQLDELLRLMTYPSEVTATVEDGTVRCQVSEEHEVALTGQDGKIMDSLQYLLRKLVARRVEEKIRLSIDVGQFREKRKVELLEKAKELALLVKEDGKTQVIPPLNPSERRIVHVALQDDKDIRSRSVGDGLFKKVLIYKPGKGKKPGGNKRGGRGRRGRSPRKPQENQDS